jgi:hypothetical protein
MLEVGRPLPGPVSVKRAYDTAMKANGASRPRGDVFVGTSRCDRGFLPAMTHATRLLAPVQTLQATRFILKLVAPLFFLWLVAGPAHSRSLFRSRVSAFDARTSRPQLGSFKLRLRCPSMFFPASAHSVFLCWRRARISASFFGAVFPSP